MKLTEAHSEALRDLSDDVTEAKASLATANDKRDQFVRGLVAEGYSYRSIASDSWLSYQRVSQIAGGADDRLSMDATLEAYCPTCEAAPGEHCVKASGRFHIDRIYRRNAIHDGEIDDVVEGEPTYTPTVAGP